MRIENNNNVNFGAYFKNNEAFKRVFAKSSTSNINKSLLDEFLHKQPAHEIEIIEECTEKFSGANYYTLFNNSLGLSCEVKVKQNDSFNTLKKLLENAIYLCKYSVIYKDTEKLYKAITNQK